MLRLWSFKSYETGSGRNVIEHWCSDCERFVPGNDDSFQGILDAVLEILQQRPQHEWGRPEFAPLGGKQKGLSEIRFAVGKVECRVVGFFGPGSGTYTMLIGSTKKGRIYDPKEALETAVKRKKEIEKDGSRCCEYDL